MQRRIGLGAGILGLWLVLSGHYDPLMVAFGIGSTVLVVFIADRMNVIEESALTLGFVIRFVAYVPWLVKEIFVANLMVARIVLAPRLPISPILVHFRGRQRTELARFIYANSITLTPGTITTSVDGQDLSIHALMWSAVDGHEEAEMVHRIARLEGRG